jgi:RNA polymerase sigma-70 factor (ECF subfamily)
VRLSGEEQLVRQAIRGDKAAIGRLYDQHVEMIYKYALYRTGDPATAEDITADVFLRVIESLDQYEERGLPFAAWLYRIAHARVVDYWRRIKRRPTLELDRPSVQAVVEEDEALRRDVVQYTALAQALQLITDEQQQVIVLKFLQGLENEEVAAIMGKTVGAIKALQHRGLESLARVLGTQNNEG